MALELKYDADTGSKYPKAYYRIVQINTAWHLRQANVTILIFRNEASRQANEQPVGQMRMSFAEPPKVEEGMVSEFELVFGLAPFAQKKTNPLEVVYNHIKTEEFFDGSKDV